MRKLAPLFATLLLLAVASLTAAQSSMPLDRVNIEQGRVNFTGNTPDPPGQFTFGGPGVSLSGRLVEGNFSPSCQPCAGGEEIHIRTIFSGELSIRPGTLTFGTTSRDIFYTGNLVFDSNPVTLPSRYTRSPIRISVPITLQGWLETYERDPFVNWPNYFLFRAPLNLQGTATLTLSMWGINSANGHPFYRFRGLSYEFPPLENAREN